MRAKLLSHAALGIGMLALAIAVWPLSPLCTGRPFGRDCESWLIVGVNVFTPFALVAIVSAVWSYNSRARAPHLLFFAALVALIAAVVLLLR